MQSFRRLGFFTSAVLVVSISSLAGCSSEGSPSGSTGGALGSVGGALGAGGSQTSGGGGSSGGASQVGGTTGAGSAQGTGASVSANGGAGAGGAGAGGAGAGGAGPGAGGASCAEAGDAPASFEITVEPNPNSVLSAYVSWTTAEPSSSIVQFGAGSLAWEIAGEDNVTSHRVLVIGMRAETEYTIRALSTGASGTTAGQGTFTTGTLPAQIPLGTVSVHEAGKAQSGWTLMNVQKGDGSTSARAGAPPAAVIYDEEGEPVWYFINGTVPERGGAISVDRTDKGVLMGATATMDLSNNATSPTECDWAGDIIWKCPDTKCGGSATLSHHTSKLTNGHYITMRDAQDGGRTSQIFEELDPTQNSVMVHSIGVLDGMPSPPAGASGDWAHGNAITVDLDSDVAYMNFRWLGLMKMQYSTGELIWHLPASYGEAQLGAFTNKVLTFDPPLSQYSDTHDPEIHADGTILFFDNGGFTGQIAEGNPGNLHTRAVEYQIDDANKTAKLVWEWPGSFAVDPWYTTDLYVPFWGGIQTTEKGTVLIAAGRRGTGSTTPESRVIEVEKTSGAVVWELKLPKDHGIYRAERIAPPLVRKLCE